MNRRQPPGLGAASPGSANGGQIQLAVGVKANVGVEFSGRGAFSDGKSARLTRVLGVITCGPPKHQPEPAVKSTPGPGGALR
jgi:hypothetical protein